MIIFVEWQVIKTIQNSRFYNNISQGLQHLLKNNTNSGSFKTIYEGFQPIQ